MEKQACPKCGTTFPTSAGWARTAVSLMIPSPAVPDMASQVRCPHCRHLFADSEVRHLSASPSKLSRALIVLACLGAVAWAVYQLY